VNHELMRERRKALHWSQADLAAKTGISQSYISEIETGTQPNVTIATIRRIAQALELDVAALMTDPKAEAAAVAA
jgi:transcriptional regulator with XRE-family HTH domain